MATNTSGRSAFVGDLARVYWTYALSFAAFVTVVAILEQVGVPERVLGYLFVFFTLGAYATIGVLARTMQVAEFYAAARRVPAIYNGMAMAAGSISGATFLGLAGAMFALGWDGLAFILGLGGGFLLIAVLIAPYLRKFGAYTVPDFLAMRFRGSGVRLAATLILLCATITYLAAQIYATGFIAARFLSIEFNTAIAIALVTILLSTVLGGMRSLTWTQVAQYIIIVIALAVPAAVTAWNLYGNPIPQIAFGEALTAISGLEQQMIAASMAEADAVVPHLTPFATLGPVNFFALAFCLMIGTASLPHMLIRTSTTRSVRQTRTSIAWAMLFLAIILTLAPAYAAFAKLEIYGSVVGAGLSALPDWVATYSGLGLVDVYGLSVEGIRARMADVSSAIGLGADDVASVATVLSGEATQAWQNLAEPVRAAIFNAVAENPDTTGEVVWQRAILASAIAGGDFDGRLHLTAFAIDRDAVLIAAPDIAGMPFALAGIVAAGALAAALSTANGLVLAIANTISHDAYFRTIAPEASTSRRLAAARLILICAAIGATWIAVSRPADIMTVVAWTFSLAASGFFPALVLGVWWKRATSWGALAGMLTGFAAALGYLAVARLAPDFGMAYLGMAPVGGAGAILAGAYVETVAHGPSATAPAIEVGWFGISSLSAAMIGVPTGLAVMIGVSLITRPHPDSADFVDEIRTPRGLSHMEKERAAERVREFGRRQR